MQMLRLAAVYSAVDKLTSPVRKMTSAVVSFDKTMQSAKAMREWGAQVSMSALSAMAASEKIKGSGRELYSHYQDLQQEVRGLDKVIRTSGKNHVASMEAAIKGAKDWEKQHGDSATKFLSMTSKMSEANLKDVDAIRASRYALGLQKGTMTDAATAGELLVVGYRELGDKSKNAADEMRKQADVATKLQEIYKLRNLEDFTAGMKEAAPAAAKMGQSYEAAAVGIVTLQKAGMDGTKAGQVYAQTVQDMQASGKALGLSIVKGANGSMDFAKTIDQLTNKYGDLKKATPQVREQLIQIFGDEGLKALEIYQRQTGAMKQGFDELGESTGALAAARDAYENSAAGRMEKSLQKLESLKVGIAEKIFGNPAVVEKIIPAFASAAEGAADMIAAFMEANPEVASGVITVGALGTGLLAIGAPIASAIGGFMTMSGTVIEACGHAGEGVGKLYDAIKSGEAMEKGKDAAKKLADGFKTAGEVGKNAVKGISAFSKSAFSAATKALPAMIASTWAWTAALLANPMTWIVLGIMALIAIIIVCIKYWDEIAAACGAAWDWIKETAGEGMKWLESLFDDFLGFLDNIGQMFYDAGAKLWNTFTEGIKSVLSGPLDLIKSALAEVDKYFPHSDAEKGPLSKLTWSGSRLLSTFANGIPKGAQKLYDTMDKELGKLAFDFPEITGDEQEKQNPFALTSGRFIPKSPDWEVEKSFKNQGNQGRIIQGPITIKVQQMNSPEDFMKTLQELAMETGG